MMHHDDNDARAGAHAAIQRWAERAEEMERAAARAALARSNERAAYLYALAECIRQGVPMSVPAPRSRL